MPQFNIGILGATGAVGQKFILLLQNHPWFTIKALGASERSAGKSYAEAANWIEAQSMPESVAGMVVRDCKAKDFSDVDFVFSGMDASVAGDIEAEFAESGIPVISNAKNFRTHPQVPLLVPEVNPDHIELIDHQNFTADRTGWIVTNPNCVVVPLVTALKPLQDNFGVEAVILTSMQAISGAGYPGVPSLDILGNVIPFIGGEESKIEWEPTKILGQFLNRSVHEAPIPIEATATRVPVQNGHMLSVTVKLSHKPKSIDDVALVMQNWESPIAGLNLPTAPDKPITLHTDDRYPQPKLHADAANGMQTAVGRLRESTVFDISFIVMAHNTIRGAAGGAILNAELLAAKGYL